MRFFFDHPSTLRVTDPALIEIFDNWAFDEVIEDALLDVWLRLMVQLASLITSRAACPGTMSGSGVPRERWALGSCPPQASRE